MSKPALPVAIALGSNLHEPAQQIKQAMAWLRETPESCDWRFSSLYGSAPMGPTDQPAYVNAVALAFCRLSPQALLAWLKFLEARSGRIKVRHWGPRCLDLDLLCVGELREHSAELTLPHPGIALRGFVLRPWAELQPDWSIPGLGTVGMLLQQCPKETEASILKGLPE